MTKNNKGVWIFAVVFLAIFITLFCQYPLLKDKYVIQDDVRPNIFWMVKFQDPKLFKNDILSRYSSWVTPIGIKSVYSLTNFFVDPIIVAKVLCFFLCPIAAIYFFKLGELAWNSKIGFLSAALFLFVAWYKEFIFFEDGGTGDFFPVLLIAFLYYFIKRDYLKTTLVIILQAIFYPPAILICLFTYGISFVRRKQKRLCIEIGRKKLLYFLTAITLCFFILFPKYLLRDKEFGKIITLPQMKSMQEFYPGRKIYQEPEPRGRMPIIFPSLYERLTNDRSGINLNSSILFLGLFSLLLLILLRKKALILPRELWCFLLASIILFMGANAVMLALFEPSRYIRTSLPIFLVFFIVVNSYRLISEVKKSIYRRTVASFIITATLVFYLPRIQGDSEYKAKDAELYSYLSTLPKDVLIAGHPRDMDNVPIFSKRKVLIMEELSLPYYPDFYEKIKERTYDFFDVYYATTPDKLCAFCSKYGITHFVVYNSHFAKDYLRNKKFYLAPFNDYIINLTKDHGEKEFILNNISEDKKLFVNKDCFVISCDKIFLCSGRIKSS